MSLPKYPAYKDSGVAWLGDVPEHWNVKRLRFVVKLNPSKSEISQLSKDTLVSFLAMDAVGDDGKINLEVEKEITEVETGYTYFRDGDVTVAKITPCFENGKGAVMQGLTNSIGFGTTELVVARPLANQTSPTYLHAIFISAEFRKNGEGAMYGAGGQKRISDDFVRNFKMAFPPLEEQIVIANFLDQETSKINALVAEQENLIALLKEKRQAVVSHAVTKGLNPNAPMKDSGIEWLGEVPAHWNVQNISSLSTKITNGYVGPTRDILMDDGVRYLQSLHIKNNKIRFDEPYFVTKEWSNAHKKSVLETGDVLIVQTGDIGQVAVVPEEFSGCNCHALIIVAPKRSIINGTWFSAVLNSDYGFHSLLSIQTGALHPHLNCGNVKNLFIPVPPIAEQVAITNFISFETTQFDTLILEAENAVFLLKERRSALISAAVTGKIDVREIA